jgi:CHASE2 domain-containing sensor protein
MNFPKIHSHAFIFGLFASLVLFGLHLLPVNQIFIDPFSEAIKQHDVMDIAFSKFRDHNQSNLFDTNIVIINSGITNRMKVGTTIQLLNQFKTKAIGVDLLFDTLSYSKADTTLHKALQSSNNVVLGYTFFEKTLGSKTLAGSTSHPFFTDKIQQAFVNLATNDGFSVRAFEPFHNINNSKSNAFALEIVKNVKPNIEETLLKRNLKKEWINFRRVQPGFTSMRFPINSGHSTHYTLIEMNDFLRDSALYRQNDYFKNKIILIGFTGESVSSFSMQDRYFTPLNEQYTGRSWPDMHGVVIHANIISMLLSNDFINDVPEWVLYLIAFLIFYLNYLFFLKLQPKIKNRSGVYIRLLQVLEFIFLFSISVLLIVQFNTKLGFFLIATAVILSFELFEIYERRLEHFISRKISVLQSFFRKK